MKALAAWAVGGLCAASLVGACGSPPPVPQSHTKTVTPASSADRSAPTEDALRVLGRHVFHADSDSYEMGWPGSGFAFRFEGGDVSVDITDGGQGIMDVVVDGTERELRLKPGTHSYTLTDGLGEGPHSLRITRRTEVFDTGLFTMGNPVITATAGADNAWPAFLLSPVPQRRILFLGDSITAGFGVRGPDAECDYRPDTNAPWQTYAALSAQKFGADFHLVAISGRGVIYNWDDNPAPVMPAQIDYALPDNPSLTWDHSQFKPDVVVVLLGTNDWSVIEHGAEWGAGYEAMLTALRDRFADAPIIAAEGPLLSPERLAKARPGIDQAIAARAAAGDKNIHRLTVNLAPTGEKYSCSYHPSAGSMRHMADALNAIIASLTGWGGQMETTP